MDLPDDLAWYEALDIVLSELDRRFSTNSQRSLVLLIRTESSYFDRVPADVSHVGGGVYRVDKYGQLSDVFTDLGICGLSSLIGVPNEAVAKVVQAEDKGVLRVAINAESSLRDILVPGTPFFELAAYQDTDCFFSARYSAECPEDVQRILDEAMRTRPDQPGAERAALKERHFQRLGEALDEAQRAHLAGKSRDRK